MRVGRSEIDYRSEQFENLNVQLYMKVQIVIEITMSNANNTSKIQKLNFGRHNEHYLVTGSYFWVKFLSIQRDGFPGNCLNKLLFSSCSNSINIGFRKFCQAAS